MDLALRTELANLLTALEEVPQRLTRQFFDAHPEWSARFGEAGRRRCTEDGRFHLSFLAAAVQAGSPGIFADYAGWCLSMLRARKIDPAHLDEHLQLLEADLAQTVPKDSAYVISIVRGARSSLLQPAEVHDDAADPRVPTRVAYLGAALSGRRGAAMEVLQGALAAGWSLEEVYRHLFLAAQQRLGTLWASAEISVAQEHMASAVTHWAMARLYRDLSVGEAPKGRALIAGVEGEQHSLPAHFVADLLEMDGWDVVFVGTGVPAPAILAAVADHNPAVVGLSATMATSLPRTVAVARELRARFPTTGLVLGGRAFHRAQALGEELDAEVDARGDLQSFARFAS